MDQTSNVYHRKQGLMVRLVVSFTGLQCRPEHGQGRGRIDGRSFRTWWCRLGCMFTLTFTLVRHCAKLLGIVVGVELD